MATLVLTAVGTAIGGPIGGAIGAVIGQAADAAIFAPKKRHGPRLGELAVQTSSYGMQIPKIFGTMRVAGTVIWATDLKERHSTSGGGKGKPKTVNYSYSASFAVALSGRPIRSVRRIWADGKLLRGAAGDLKSETRYRLYRGDEEQPADPLIASAEGTSQTPAYRGIAYAMFEEFQLADYGNRIPSLTFEVEAEAAPVAIGAIAEELSGGLVRAGETPMLAGYAASGDSVRGALQGLAELVPLSLAYADDGLTLGRPGGSVEALEGGDTFLGRGEIRRGATMALPEEVSVAYYDAARDYQTGLQRAIRSGPSQRVETIALPAVLNAGEAKAFARHRLEALWVGRSTAKLHFGWRRISSRPGMRVRIPAHPGSWRIERCTLQAMMLTLELARIPETPAVVAHASPGRPIGYPDLLQGPTTLLLLDLPSFTDELPKRPLLLAAAAGTGAGWRRAALSASYDGGVSWSPAGETGAPAVMGRTLGALPAAGSALIDARYSVEVELLNDSMWLEGREDAAMAGGANLALIGNELVQFGEVEPLGNRRFRLRRLLRGRRGTEWAAGDHAADEPFVLIEAESLMPIEPPLAVLGGEARLMGIGLGDGDAPPVATCVIGGEAIRPPSPVHLRAERNGAGDVSISWVRRSRAGWAWLSGSDTPLGEEQETYSLTLSGAGFVRNVTVAEPHHVYTAVQQSADAVAGPLAIEVVQVGTAGSSRPAQLNLSSQ